MAGWGKDGVNVPWNYLKGEGSLMTEMSVTLPWLPLIPNWEGTLFLPTPPFSRELSLPILQGIKTQVIQSQ